MLTKLPKWNDLAGRSIKFDDILERPPQSCKQY